MFRGHIDFTSLSRNQISRVMLLDELPIFEQIKNDILTNATNNDRLQPGVNASSRDNMSKRRKNKVRFSINSSMNFMIQPPLSAYTANETRPFLISHNGYGNNRGYRIRKSYEEGSISIERRIYQINSIRKLGINLFRPIGFQYRKADFTKYFVPDKVNNSDIHDPTRNNNHDSSFQFLENTGLAINMNAENVDNSLVVPRQELFNDRTFNGGNSIETSMSDYNNTTTTTSSSSMSEDNIDENEEQEELYSRNTQHHITNSSNIQSGLFGFDGTLPYSYDGLSIPSYQSCENCEEEPNINNESISDKSMDDYLNEIEGEDW